MTSANKAEEPICISNLEAVDRLKGIADFFLVHDRDILVRCDDSIAAIHSGRTSISRRSRGFAPRPLVLRESYPAVLALGGQLKTTVCLIKENLAFLSPHIGDLENAAGEGFFPGNAGAHAPHYRVRTRSDRLRPSSGLLLDPQCCQDGRRAGRAGAAPPRPHRQLHGGKRHLRPVIGLAMDGTGYGADGQVWGVNFSLPTRCPSKGWGTSKTSFSRVEKRQSVSPGV